MGKGTHAHACAHTWSAVGQRAMTSAPVEKTSQQGKGACPLVL